MDEPKRFSKQWHTQNREYNRNKRNEFIKRNPGYDNNRIVCEDCGVEYSRSNKSHHRKTLTHLNILKDAIRKIEYDK